MIRFLIADLESAKPGLQNRYKKIEIRGGVEVLNVLNSNQNASNIAIFTNN